MVDLRDLHDRLAEMQNYYSALRSRWQKDYEFYAGTFKFKLPAGVDKVIPSTGRNAIDVPSSHIVTDRPVVKRRTQLADGTNKANDDDKAESFMQGWLMENASWAKTPPAQEGVKFQLLRGMAVRKGPFFNLRKWDNFTGEGRDKKRNPAPGWVWWDFVDPWNVYLDPCDDPREVFFESVITVGQMYQKAEQHLKFRAWKDLMNRPRTDRMALVEWYGFVDDDKTCTYAAFEGHNAATPTASGRTPVSPVVNPITGEWISAPAKSYYTYLPARACYSGYGIRSEGAAPEELAESILNSQVKTLLIREAKAETTEQAYMEIATWGRMRAKSQHLLERTTIDPAPATVSVIPEGVEPMEAQDLPAAVVSNRAHAKEDLEEALYSGVVAGNKVPGVYTASGTAMMMGTARLKFGPPLSNMEHAHAELLTDFCKLLVTIADMEDMGGEEVEFSCRGRTLKASQLHDDYAFAVELLSESPEEKSAKIATGERLAASPYAPSRKRIYENFWGIENYSEEEEQLIYEQLVHSDATKAYLQKVAGIPLSQKVNQGAQQGSQIAALQQLNASAGIMRAAGPGGMVQAPPMPGSVQMQAQQANAMQNMGQPPPTPQMPLTPAGVMG